jgi:hypothetical protein
MSASQSFEQWNPFGSVVGAVAIEGLSDVGDEPFCITLRLIRDPDQRLRLLWERPHAYRNIDESYRVDLWQTFATYGHPFWIVRDSDWIKEFRASSGGVADRVNLQHYAIYTDDDCIDVLSATPPTTQRVSNA